MAGSKDANILADFNRHESLDLLTGRLMDLIAIVVTVCAVAQPDHCEEQRLEYMWNGSLTQCVMTAQPYIARWIGEHPKWSVKSYHCEYPRAKEKADSGGSAGRT